MADLSQVGPGTYGDGATPPLRSGRNQDLIVSELHGKYYEQVSRGNVFHLGVTWTTSVAAGNIAAAAAAAATQFAIWNPITNNKNICLLRLTLSLISGTTPVGPVSYSQFSGVGVPSIASAGTPYNALFGNAATPSAKYMASAAGTALTGGGAIVTTCTAGFYFTAGTYANLAVGYAADDIDGRIVLAPGQGFVPVFAAAGTTLLGAWGLIWEEVNV